jgi:hypothetical protein
MALWQARPGTLNNELCGGAVWKVAGKFARRDLRRREGIRIIDLHSNAPCGVGEYRSHVILGCSPSALRTDQTCKVDGWQALASKLIDPGGGLTREGVVKSVYPGARAFRPGTVPSDEGISDAGERIRTPTRPRFSLPDGSHGSASLRYAVAGAEPAFAAAAGRGIDVAKPRVQRTA